MPLLFRGIFISIVLILFFIHTSISQQKNHIIIIDQEGGNNTTPCCKVSDTVSNICNCSNLTLALQNMENNTEILINSNINITISISLHAAVLLRKSTTVSNVNITGNNHPHPIVMCDSQKGDVNITIRNVHNISIKNITWDQCKVQILKCTNVTIFSCQFQLSLAEYALIINNSSALVEDSKFIDNIGDLWIHSSSSVTICGCSFTNSGNIEWTKHKSFNSEVSAGHAIYCSTSSNFTLKRSNVSNYINSAVILIDCPFNMIGNVMFSNNTAGIFNSSGKESQVEQLFIRKIAILTSQMR